jgi:hypothetical protein
LDIGFHGLLTLFGNQRGRLYRGCFHFGPEGGTNRLHPHAGHAFLIGGAGVAFDLAQGLAAANIATIVGLSTRDMVQPRLFSGGRYDETHERRMNAGPTHENRALFHLAFARPWPR